MDWDALLDDQFDSNSYNTEVSEYDPNWEQDREPQENRITTIPPLVEQLYEQLTLSDLSGADVEIAGFIIGNIEWITPILFFHHRHLRHHRHQEEVK